MISVGYAWITILKIKNNTDRLIENVNFIYNSDETSIKLKNIKPNENKQTGVSSLYDVKNLKMIVDGVDKSYLIKSEIPKGYMNTITITINSITFDNCEFDITECE